MYWVVSDFSSYFLGGQNLPKKNIRLFSLLLVLVLLASGLFLTYHTYGNWSFALHLRGVKLVTFILVACITSFATITFQTVTHNQFLTPNILGIDTCYVLIQTLTFFIRGNHQPSPSQSLPEFLNTILLLTLFSTILIYSLLKTNDLFRLLMLGLILGTFFTSLSTFLQVIMDPNEYDNLQTKLFASFTAINTQHLVVATLLAIFLMVYLWQKSNQLNVLALGKAQAQNLGLAVEKLQISLLLVICSLVGIATALIGPLSFLGFISANLCYQMFTSYHHQTLFIGASLIAALLLIIGQFAIEQLFELNAPLSAIIEFCGGAYFILKIIGERKPTL